jgi:hypothetical protein
MVELKSLVKNKYKFMRRNENYIAKKKSCNLLALKNMVIIFFLICFCLSCNNMPSEKESNNFPNQELAEQNEKKVSNKFIGQTYSQSTTDSFGGQSKTFLFQNNGTGQFLVSWTVYGKYHQDQGELLWEIIDGEIQLNYTYNASDGVVSKEEELFEYDEENNRLVSTEYKSVILKCVSSGQEKQKTNQADFPEDWKTIDEHNYTIHYPDSFELSKAGQMGTSFVLFSKQTSKRDLFRENINLLIQDLGGQKIDLDEYVELSEKQVKTLITNGNLIESKRIKTTETEYHKIIYTGVQGKFNLKFEQYFWIMKGEAYILTLTCEVNQFANYKKIGEKIMNTFRIK